MPGVWIAAALSIRSLYRGLMPPWWSDGPQGISARVCVGGGKVAAATPPKGLKERSRRLYIYIILKERCSVVVVEDVHDRTGQRVDNHQGGAGRVARGFGKKCKQWKVKPPHPSTTRTHGLSH